MSMIIILFWFLGLSAATGPNPTLPSSGAPWACTLGESGELSNLDRALEFLFPRPALRINERFRMVLRYLPSFHPEAQIILSYTIDSKARVEYRTLARPLRQTLEGPESKVAPLGSEELARISGLVHSQFSVPPDEMRQWLTAFFDSLRESGPLLHERVMQLDGTREIPIQVDGTGYSVEVEAGQDRLSFDLIGSEIDNEQNRQDIPTIRWMNTVRHRVTAIARPGGGP